MQLPHQQLPHQHLPLLALQGTNFHSILVRQGVLDMLGVLVVDYGILIALRRFDDNITCFDMTFSVHAA